MAMEGTVQSIEVSADPQHVCEVALDLESYPEWVTAVRSVEILEEDDEGRPKRVSFSAAAMVREIEYTLVYSYEADDGFTWVAEPGADIRALEGSYKFHPLESGGTKVLYALRVDPAFSIPGFLRRQADAHGAAPEGVE